MAEIKFIRINNRFINFEYVKEIKYSNDYYEITIANTEINLYRRMNLEDRVVMCHKDDFNLCSVEELKNVE